MVTNRQKARYKRNRESAKERKFIKKYHEDKFVHVEVRTRVGEEERNRDRDRKTMRGTEKEEGKSIINE